MKKRLFSTLLILVMVFSVLSATAFASGSVVEVADKDELTSAIQNAADGTTIKLTADITVDQLQIYQPITLDLGENTLTTTSGYGGILLKNGPTIKNGTIVHTGKTAAIKAFKAAAIEDLVIDVTYDGSDGPKVIGGIVVQNKDGKYVDSIKNVTIKGVGLTNGIETYNCGDETCVIGSMENVTIDSRGVGLNISAPVGTATGCDIHGDVSGIEIWIKGNYSASLHLVDCEITGGQQAVHAHDEFNATPGIENTGTIELTADSDTTFANDGGTLLALTNAHSSSIDVATITADAAAKVVAADGTETYYATLEDAEDAAQNGETVENLKLLEIWTLEDLADFRDAVNNGDTFVGKTVILMADIDLSGIESWVPIGNTTNYFRGTFDGQENTISNMNINVNTPDTDQFVGLFGGVRNAVIKNLTMENTSITAVGKKVRAAAIVGIADSDKTTPSVLALNFENITVDGCTINAEAKAGSALVGGVVGYSYPANMKNIAVSYLTINAKAEGNEVRAAAINGYVCGQNISNNGSTRMAFTIDTFNVENVSIIADAYTVFAGGYAPYTYYGYITLKNGTIDGLKMDVDAHEAFVGGLVGYFWRSDSGHTVNNVMITGIDFDVTTDYLGETRVGGMVGTSQSPNTKYTDCSVSGKIVERCSDSENPVNYHAKVGGFVARTYEYAMQTYTNCVADVDVTGSNVAGGFVGNHNSTVSYVNCEAKGDVTADIAGGFAGRLTEHGYTTAVTFDGCKASGNVCGTNVAGGLIGSAVNHGWAAWEAGKGTPYAKTVTLKDCEVTGTVTSGTDYCAGVVGEAVMADGIKLILDDTTIYPIEPACYPDSKSIEVIEYVAEIDGEKFVTLQAALNAAAAGTGEVVVEILKDIDLTDVDWNPVVVSAPGYPLITVNGNNKTITGLNDMLFASTWAGKSGLIINDLTIKNSNIVNDAEDSHGNIGVGAFIGYPQASSVIELNNCHLINSTVEGGHWTGGLIGMAGGYNGNDGPVFMNLTIDGCSVINSTITGKGSVGGVIGHGSCAAWTQVVITDTEVKNNTISSTGSSNVKAGSIMGTIGAAGQETTAAGETKTGGAEVCATTSGNDVTSNDTPITTIYGRQGTETGVLILTKGGDYEHYPIEENVVYAMPETDLAVLKTIKNTWTVARSEYTVTFVSEGENVDTQTVPYAGNAQPVHVRRDGYKFLGWYLNGEAYDFDTLVTEDLTLTAKWEVLPVVPVDSDAYKVTVAVDGVRSSHKKASEGEIVTLIAENGLNIVVLDENGDPVKLTYKNGKYTFVMPDSDVTITVKNTFVDVAENAYYAKAVLWAVDKGITTGTSATTFSPDMVCTRAHAVTFLWRAAGSPEPVGTEMPFADVAKDAYYYDAVLWAVENGITNGTSATTFSPDAECTRGQIVTFLWRAQGAEDASAKNPFTDVAEGAYYADAVLWAVENGITTGTGADTFSPDADCTRGQIVTFLWRCLAE